MSVHGARGLGALGLPGQGAPTWLSSPGSFHLRGGRWGLRFHRIKTVMCSAERTVTPKEQVRQVRAVFSQRF